MSKNKNFVFAERVKLEHHLNTNMDVSAIKLAKILNRSRSSIYYELKHFTIRKVPAARRFNMDPKEYACPILKRFPFVSSAVSIPGVRTVPDTTVPMRHKEKPISCFMIQEATRKKERK